MRMSVDQAYTFRRLGHFYRVDRDRAACVLLLFALSGEGYRTCRDRQRRFSTFNSCVVCKNSFCFISYCSYISNTGNRGCVIAPCTIIILYTIGNGSSCRNTCRGTSQRLTVICLAVCYSSDGHSCFSNNQLAGCKCRIIICSGNIYAIRIQDCEASKDAVFIRATSNVCALGRRIVEGQNIAFAEAFHSVVISIDGFTCTSNWFR